MRTNRNYRSVFLFCFILFSTGLHAQCPITVDAGPNKFVCSPGQTVQLDGSISGNYLGLRWTPAMGLNDPNILTPTATVNNAVVYTLTGAAFDPAAPNLVFNPGFELGNTGFTTSLSYNPTPITPGTYVLTTSPALVLANFPPCDDHTFGNGTGYMMLINGTGLPNAQVWCQNIPVMPNSWYSLSAWVMNSPISPPTLQFAVNNVLVGAPFDPPSSGCDWQEFTATWFSGAATNATLCIRDLSTGGNGLFGCDYALDDIFMSKACAVTDQVTVAVATVNAVLPASITLPCSALQTGIQLNGSASSSGPGYTYSWDGPGILSGQNTPVATVNEPGLYTLTVSFDTGNGICTKSASINVLPDPTMVMATAEGGEELTCVQKITMLSGIGSSSGPNISYNWQPASGVVSGQGTLTPVVNQPGTYTLTVTHNSSGCTATAEVFVAQNITPVVAVAGAPGPITCVPGTVTLNGTGSSSGFDITYEWTGPGIVSGATTLNNCVVNVSGLYTLTVTNEVNGCTAKATVNVAQMIVLPAAVANAEVPGALDCTTPSLVLNSTGSSTGPSFSYLWATPNGHFIGPVNGETATVDSLGLYILTVTNNQTGCTKTDTVSVGGNFAPPAILIKKPTPTLHCAADSVRIDAGLSSSGPEFSYVWTTANGHILSGDSTLMPWVDSAGTYIVSGLNAANGCTATDTVKIVFDTLAPAVVIVLPLPLNCLVDTLVLDASGSSSGPRIVRNWVFTPLPGGSGPGFVSGDTTLMPVVNAAGIYALTLTDTINQCTTVDSVAVAQDTMPPVADAGPTATLDCVVQTAVLDGSGSSQGPEFSYLWTGGDTSLQLSVHAPGTYSLSVTNSVNGCISVDTTTVTRNEAAPDVAIATPEPLTCDQSQIQLSASASVGPEFLYLWSFSGMGPGILSGGTTLMPVVGSPGDYTLLVTNTATGCTSTATTTVVQLSSVMAEVTGQTDATCFGAADGTLGVAAAGGNGVFTYQWNTGENTPTLQNLSAGTYTLTVTDGENCSATISLTIQQPDELLANATATGITAPGNTDGGATADPNGGTALYTFAWSTGQSEQTISGLAPGIYTVTVTDANGCTAAQTVEVWDANCNLTAGISATDPTCHGLTNGIATALTTGGSFPVVYSWSSGATTQTAENLAAGIYSVTITDANDCTVVAGITLNEPPVLTLALVGVVNTTCPNSAEGSASVVAGGGTGGINILWSDGQQGSPAIGLIAGAYTATATDSNGCMASVQVAIQADDQEPPVIQAGAGPLLVGQAGLVTLTLQNLGIIVTDNCVVGSIEFEPKSFDCLDLGVQQVTVMAADASGNNSVLTFSITVVDQETPSVVCPPNTRRCFGDNTVEYIAPVATDNCLTLGGQFDLIEGLPSGAPFPEGVTTTTYTFTDVSGNIGSCSFQVTILSPLNVALDTILHDVGAQNTGSIQVTVSGSLPGYVFAWQRDGQTIATTEDVAGIGAGIYTLLVTDAYGCTQVAGPFEVSNLVGTTGADWSAGIALYPNPTTGKLFVVFPDVLTDADVHCTVFDALGRSVQEQHARGQKQVVLDWTNLADGLYTILIRTRKGEVAYRVVLGR
ncbi:MAG: HYR domain-containing protein [Lewinellaceae bacterium]|nr:HYR domain-containing protein [Lewinellaceae bacterium]